MTSSAEHHDAAKLTALAASALLVGDLFLTWQRTTVRMGGGFDIHTTDSGWTGWGLFAGVLAIVVIVLVGTREEHPLATLLAAAGMLMATALAVFVGDSHVSVMMPGLGVEVGSTRWPAWLGLALAAIAAAACYDAYRTGSRTATPPPRGVTPPTTA